MYSKDVNDKLSNVIYRNIKDDGLTYFNIKLKRRIKYLLAITYDYMSSCRQKKTVFPILADITNIYPA